MKNRMISLFVCLCLVLALVPALALPVSASTKGRTREEAVAWVKKQIGKYLDYNKKDPWGAQCVDLIKYYYAYLGNAKYGTGNATNYQKNKLPSGWKRVTSDPKPGDVIVWGGGTTGGPGWKVSKYGHVGIVIAVDGNKLTTVEQNIHGSPCKKATRYASYATCFIRPDFDPARDLTIRYNVNGGTLTIADYTASEEGIILKKGKESTSKWSYGSGNPKYGLANATTFGLTCEGYAFVGWSLSPDGSSTIFDQNDTSLKAEDICPEVEDGSTSVTLYAIWELAKYTLYCNYNDSGKNYLYGSDFASDIDSEWWLSRDTSVNTLSVDSTERHNGYNALKIVNTAAGSSEKDFGILTLTQGNQKDNGYVGDTKPMTLSFWAKSSKQGTKIFFRWGYEGSKNYRSVTLTTDWAYYTVSMDKTPSFNRWIHPYINAAGTVWLAELQLEDGETATDFVPETGGMFTSATQLGQDTYSLPEPPIRDGYSFDGWYTAADGGEEVTVSTPVKDGNFSVYAHWTEGHEHAYVAEVTPPTCTENGFTTYTCESCGDSYEADSIPALGHSFEDGTCIRCGEIDEDFIGEIIGLEEGRLPFEDVRTYTDGIFSDVSVGQWFTENVKSVYCLGLMQGTAENRFTPGDNVTIAQAVTLAARLHNTYYDNGETFEGFDGGFWYDPYVNYLKRYSVLAENYDYNRPATREEFAHILAAAFPDQALEAQRAEVHSFADENMITYWTDVEQLYLAGVINGVEENGKLFFKPTNPISRAEAAAIVTRMAKPDLRVL